VGSFVDYVVVNLDTLVTVCCGPAPRETMCGFVGKAMVILLGSTTMEQNNGIENKIPAS